MTLGCSTFYVYDDNELVWNKLPNMPIPCYNHSMISITGTIYIVGEPDSGLSMCSLIHTYNTTSHEWAMIKFNDSLRGPSDPITSLVLGEKIFSIGRCDE